MAEANESARISAPQAQVEQQWADIESDLRQVFGAYVQAYHSGMMVEDVLHDTFVVAWQCFDPDRGTLKNFCMKVGKNVIISDLRRVNVELEKQAQLWALEQECEQPLDIAATALLHEFPRQRWLLTKAIMKGNTTEAKVLAVMYEHIVDTGDVPSLRTIGRIVGMSAKGVSRALERIVEKVHQAEEALMFQPEMMSEVS